MSSARRRSVHEAITPSARNSGASRQETRLATVGFFYVVDGMSMDTPGRTILLLIVFCVSLSWDPRPSFAAGAEAIYIDCRFSGNPAASDVMPKPDLVLRFMLNTRLELAFRIDTPLARPVLFYVEEDGGFSLLDYREGRDTVLISVRQDGASVYSRHYIDPALETQEGGLGEQRTGRCGQSQRLASWLRFSPGFSEEV